MGLDLLLRHSYDFPSVCHLSRRGHSPIILCFHILLVHCDSVQMVASLWSSSFYSQTWFPPYMKHSNSLLDFKLLQGEKYIFRGKLLFHVEDFSIWNTHVNGSNYPSHQMCMPYVTYLGSAFLLWAENYSLPLSFPTQFATAEGHVVRAETWEVLLELVSLLLCFRHCHERITMRVNLRVRHVWNWVVNKDLQNHYHAQRDE